MPVALVPPDQIGHVSASRPAQALRQDWPFLTVELVPAQHKIDAAFEPVTQAFFRSMSAMRVVRGRLLHAGFVASSLGCDIAHELDDEPILGMLRSMMGSAFTKLRQLDPARDCFKEAIAVRRRLMAARPSIYAPDVAMTLNLQGGLQAHFNDLESALRSFIETAELYRHAATAQ
jgi:hypothetical protein